MGYRRLFIMRKDLKMSPGKLAAQVAHCTELYWMNFFKALSIPTAIGDRSIKTLISKNIYDNYINNSFVKTICEAKNRSHLLKAKVLAENLHLIEDIDFGLVYDECRTELVPEEENGTTLTGIWFAPLPDDVVHSISKKYHLYV